MNIAIDGRIFLNKRSGIGQYTHYLILALLEENTGHNLFLFGFPKADRFTPIPSMSAMEKIRNVVDKPNFVNVPFPFRKVYRLIDTSYDRLVKQLRIDVVLWTNYFGIYSYAYKSIITICDMAHYYYPQYTFPGSEEKLTKELGEHARKADLILCISENTKKDVINILGIAEDKIYITYMGVSEEFRCYENKSVINDFRRRADLPEKFILFVGNVEPRKNLARMIEAYHLLKYQYNIEEPLVIVGGKGWKNEHLHQRIKEMKLEHKILFTGYVSDGDLPLYYNAATVFAYPSLYEGFGIPVIEAMACGVPVVTSNVSSLPEVAGDAAVLVNPEEPEEIAAAIYRIMIDEDLYESMREKGFKQASKFTWAACAKKTLEAISYVI